MTMTATTTRKHLELLIEFAPQLRIAGVAHLELGDLLVDLHPAQVAIHAEPETIPEPEAAPGPDPWAYGESPDAVIPGFSKLREPRS